MIKLILNKDDWNSVLSNADSYDFYHTYEYHHTVKKNDEIPILFSYKQDNIRIMIPFLKRKVNSDYYDLTSAHGYVGPVSNGIDDNFNNEDFMNEFKTLLIKENIVSIFSKLNPFIKNQEIILSSKNSTIIPHAEMVYFNQQLEDEIQLQDYNRNTKQKIRQLKKISYIEEVALDSKDFKSFVEFYHKGMKRVNAQSIFYFNNVYFKTLLESSMCDAKMIVVKHNETNDIMAGVFCINTKEIAHIELAFTNEAYFRLSPIRILFEECRKIYKNKTLKYLNLGGGSGGREGSLMKFKATFSKNYIKFSIWNFIVMQSTYESLLDENQKKEDSTFFPKYRLKLVS